MTKTELINSIAEKAHCTKKDADAALSATLAAITEALVNGEKVAITGFRDAEFINLLNENGFDASDKYTVTKDVKYLIAADPNSNSSKIIKAKKYGISIYSKSDFIAMNNIILQ